MSHLKTYLPHLFGNKVNQSFKLPESIEWEKLKFEEQLMFHTLSNTLDSFTKTLTLSDLNPAQVNHLFSFKDHLDEVFFHDLMKMFHVEYELFLKAKKGEILKTEEVQEVLNYKNYELSIFAIFGRDRKVPGRLFVKDGYGKFVHNPDGSVWSLPVLGVSGRGLPFNHSNGTTPCGVYTVDSVMPEANQVPEFGKFRRLIVNFIPKTPNENKIKQFLPNTHYKKDWYLQCIVARDLGRSLLRIHGTGTINKNPFSPHFPMSTSSGCLTTTETHLWGLVQTNHQRKLLDTLMKASRLETTYENESKIHGLLYVIDFDGTYQTLEFKS